MKIKFDNYCIKAVQFVAKVLNILIPLPLLKDNSQVMDYYDLSINPILFDSSSRLPHSITPVSGSLKKNAFFNAGKVIAFSTNSKVIEIYVQYSKIAVLSNMSIHSASAIDIIAYSDDKRESFTMSASSPIQLRIHKRAELWEDQKNIKIYLPGYARLCRISIGIEKSANIYNEKSQLKPITFYGSSITQGCSASTPIHSYPHLVADYFNYPLKNFGFSESAKGENNVINYIASIPSALFVIEYDHNADVDLLKRNHYDVYKVIREKNPKTPIIFLSRFSGGLSISLEEEDERIMIIKSTIEKAKLEGDTRVFFISGKAVIPEKDKYFVDDRHPNNLGMKTIANCIIDCIEKNELLGNKE